MNTIDELVDELYKNTVDIVLDGFEGEDIEIVRKKYYENLKEQYSGLDEYIKDYDRTYARFFEFESSEWKEKTLEEKKRTFIEDVAMNRIIDISSIAFESAKARLNENKLLPKELAEELIDKLVASKQSVMEFNRELSEWHLSETYMDLMYSSGMTDNMSRRIGHMHMIR